MCLLIRTVSQVSDVAHRPLVIVRNFASECEFETAVKGVNIRHYETLTLSN